ncbi:bleomycin resistance protein [Cupriavidus sp. USMAA2-4]|uniref:VOC family protein n=1 Tax=Cupriavidus sp. USMAA2-4 TaxID=876364 RepID=UPI0008A66758|nr:VOC family protein [Cupriavidus sp. USMAA2-4]AOY94660.1 bleomycin resistance protein [Cupriavidus sp. USMAA2-4]
MTLNMIVPLEVGIAVRDLAPMRRFYEQVLGLAFVSEVQVPAAAAAQAAMHRDGYTAVRLQTPRGERVKLLAPATPPAHAAVPGYILDKANASYLTFIVDDLQAVVERLAAAGARLLTGPRRVEVRAGTWLAFCHDPEGNVLEFVQYDDIAAYRPDLFPAEAH